MQANAERTGSFEFSANTRLSLVLDVRTAMQALPLSTREQGGWVIRPYGTGRPELHRTSPGTRDRMGYDVVIRPNEFECGCVIVGFYHTHPNTREEGYGPNANRGDYNFLYYIGVPGMIRSHSGYEYVPLPEGK